MFNPIEAITSEIFRHKEVMWLAVVKIILSTGLEMMHHLIISSDCCKYMEEVQMVLSLSSSKDALTHVVSQVCRVNCHQYLPCQCRPSRKRRTTSHRYLSIVGHGFSSQRNIRNQKELYTIIHIHLHTYMIWFDQEFLNHDNCCLRHSSPNRNCGHVGKSEREVWKWPAGRESGLCRESLPTFFWTKREPKVQPTQWYVRANAKEWETEKWWLVCFQTLTNLAFSELKKRAKHLETPAHQVGSNAPHVYIYIYLYMPWFEW